VKHSSREKGIRQGARLLAVVVIDACRGMLWRAGIAGRARDGKGRCVTITKAK